MSDFEEIAKLEPAELERRLKAAEVFKTLKDAERTADELLGRRRLTTRLFTGVAQLLQLIAGFAGLATGYFAADIHFRSEKDAADQKMKQADEKIANIQSREEKLKQQEESTAFRETVSKFRLEKADFDLLKRQADFEQLGAKNDEAQEQLARTLSAQANAQENTTRLQSANAELEAQLAAANEKLKAAGENQFTQKVAKTIEENKQVAAEVEAGRVRLEFQAPAAIITSERIKRLVEEVASAGYTYVRTRQVTQSPNTTEVRYYRAADEVIAGKLSELLQKRFKFDSVRTVGVNGADLPDGYIQVSFAPDAFPVTPLPPPKVARKWAVQIGFGTNYSTDDQAAAEARKKKIQSAQPDLPAKAFSLQGKSYLLAGRYPDRDSAEELLDQFRNGKTELGGAVKGTNFFGRNPLPPPLRVVDVAASFPSIDY